MQKSKAIKNDEFYTLWQDIADELPLYQEQLRGKRILCPCDWDESYNEALVDNEEGHVAPNDLFSTGGSVKRINVARSKNKIERKLDSVKCHFVKFLVSHAEAYGIKSVSVSGYDPSSGQGVKFQDVDYSKYDIVITNPPFSVFREFISTLFANKMKFLIIGPTNALTYKDMFVLVLNNEMWLGYHHHMTGFALPDGEILPKNDALVRFCCWYTNLDVSYRHDKMILTKKYDSEKNPHYDNYDAIEVGKTLDIPYDYDGLMGVPITFLQKYNPEQFEILGMTDRQNTSGLRTKKYSEQDTPRFNDLNARSVIKIGDSYKAMFARILIRNKEVYHNENDD